jgi:hypothetical protein
MSFNPHRPVWMNKLFMVSFKKISCATFVMVALFSVFPSVIFAQTSVSFKISPTLIEENAESSKTISSVLHLQNMGTDEMTLYPIARNITGIGADQHPVYATAKDANEFELASWVSYEESELTISPGEKRDLHFTVKFPENARPGSHMAGIFLADKPSQEIKQGSSIGFEVGAIMHFRMAGEVIDDTRIREFFSTKIIYGTAYVPFTIRLENVGNSLARPRGIIDITNMFGKKIASLPVNEEGAAVFPKAMREFNATWNPEDMQIGRFEALVALSIEGANGSQTISRVLQFWILPMNILTPILGGFLTLILVVYILLRLYVRSQLRGIRSSRTVTRSAGLSRLTAVVIGLLVAIIIGLFILFFYFG